MNNNSIDIGFIQGGNAFLCLEKPYAIDILKMDEEGERAPIDKEHIVVWSNGASLRYLSYQELQDTFRANFARSLEVTWKKVHETFFQKFLSFTFPNAETPPQHIAGFFDFSLENPTDITFIKNKIFKFLDSQGSDTNPSPRKRCHIS